MAAEPSAPSDPRIHERISLGTAPPPYSEVNIRSSLDLDTLDERVRRRMVKKARRRVKNIKIGTASLVILLFLMSLM